MLLLNLALTKELPFTKVYLHGLVRDEQGRKMSKSLGNVIDPLDVIEGITLGDMIKRNRDSSLNENEIILSEQHLRKKYPEGIKAMGADALRFAFLKHDMTGVDVNMDVNETVTEGYKFCNKLWNVSKFAKISFDNVAPDLSSADQLLLKDDADVMNLTKPPMAYSYNNYFGNGSDDQANNYNNNYQHSSSNMAANNNLVSKASQNDHSSPLSFQPIEYDNTIYPINETVFGTNNSANFEDNINLNDYNDWDIDCTDLENYLGNDSSVVEKILEEDECSPSTPAPLPNFGHVVHEDERLPKAEYIEVVRQSDASSSRSSKRAPKRTQFPDYVTENAYETPAKKRAAKKGLTPRKIPGTRSYQAVPDEERDEGWREKRDKNNEAVLKSRVKKKQLEEEKEKVLTELRDKSKNDDRKMHNLEKTLADKDRVIAEKDRLLRGKDARIASLETELRQKEFEIQQANNSFYPDPYENTFNNHMTG
uniref:Valine--tRNA ligase n=1 Tax=Rhabditophanes sp. KR3021 TaxID=114890 RepID=A0AC35UGI2_9BILA